MLTLLSFLEAKQHNRYDNANDDINSLEYQKPSYGPYSNFDVANNDDGIVNDGEWWNEYIEPSVQYYGNSRGYFNEDPRKHLTSTGIQFHGDILVYEYTLRFYSHLSYT